MERCAGCGQELASTWKFCIHCGLPQPVRRPRAAERVVPSAIRPAPGTAPDAPAPRGKYDAPFWVGVGMGALGLALIVYAAIQIYTTYG